MTVVRALDAGASSGEVARKISAESEAAGVWVGRVAGPRRGCLSGGWTPQQGGALGGPRPPIAHLERKIGHLTAAQGAAVLALCQMSGQRRAGYYRWRTPPAATPVEMELRRQVQQVALEWPAYGYRRITNVRRPSALLTAQVLMVDSRHTPPVYPNLAREIRPQAISARPRESVSAVGFKLSLNEFDETAADRARKRGACSCSPLLQDVGEPRQA